MYFCKTLSGLEKLHRLTSKGEWTLIFEVMANEYDIGVYSLVQMLTIQERHHYSVYNIAKTLLVQKKLIQVKFAIEHLKLLKVFQHFYS